MTCCVPYCSSYTGKSRLDGKPSVSFHEFPVTDIREAWIKAISREGPNKTLWQPHETAKVCSIHFKLEDYKECLKGRRLKPNAVPSIFPGYPAYMQRSAECIRRKASTLPQRRLSEAFPTVSTHPPRSKKRLLCNSSDDTKPSAETTSTTSTSEAADSTSLTAKKPCKRKNMEMKEPHTPPIEPTTQQTLEHVPASKDSRAPASTRPLVVRVATCKQCPPVTDECSALSGQDADCLDEHRTLGTQTTMTGVTMSALCDEIRLLKQRCHDLQSQLNKAHAENCQLKMKIRSNQGPCGTWWLFASTGSICKVNFSRLLPCAHMLLEEMGCLHISVQPITVTCCFQRVTCTSLFRGLLPFHPFLAFFSVKETICQIFRFWSFLHCIKRCTWLLKRAWNNNAVYF